MPVGFVVCPAIPIPWGREKQPRQLEPTRLGVSRVQLGATANTAPWPHSTAGNDN